MNPVASWLVTTAGLWLIVGGLAVSEVRKGLRDRRLDREARERRDRAAGVLSVAGADRREIRTSTGDSE